MKKLLLVACMSASLPFCAMAQEPIEGTWKVDLSKVQMPAKPYVFLLQNGTSNCTSCVPAISVKADGSDQKVSGHPYYDSVAVKVVDDHTVQETDRKNGKVVTTSTMTVTADGKTASFEFSDGSDSNAAPVTGKAIDSRVAKGPAGSHAGVSGSWRTTSFQNVSDNGLTFTYAMKGDSLSMSTPTGQSYTAKLDGSDAPYQGDPGTTSVSVKRLEQDVRAGNRQAQRQADQRLDDDPLCRWQDPVDRLQGPAAGHHQLVRRDEAVAACRRYAGPRVRSARRNLGAKRGDSGHRVAMVAMAHDQQADRIRDVIPDQQREQSEGERALAAASGGGCPSMPVIPPSCW